MEEYHAICSFYPALGWMYVLCVCGYGFICKSRNLICLVCLYYVSVLI